jgi:hypothetical protein
MAACRMMLQNCIHALNGSARNRRDKMTITTKTIKFLGKRITFFQVCKGAEVVRVCETQQQAQQWIEANK